MNRIAWVALAGFSSPSISKLSMVCDILWWKSDRDSVGLCRIVANSTVILSWSIRLFPAVFVVTTCTMSFQRDRGQLTNAVSLGGGEVASAVGVAVVEAFVVGGSDSLVARWTESFSSTSLVVIELMIP